MKNKKGLILIFALIIIVVISIIVFHGIRNVEMNNKIRNKVDNKADNKENGTNNFFDNNVKVNLYSKKQLENIVGEKVKKNNGYDIYKNLTKKYIWEKEGFSEGISQKIAEEFLKENNKVINILNSIAKNDTIKLKVVIVNKKEYKRVKIGSEHANFNEVRNDEKLKLSSKNIIIGNNILKKIKIEIKYAHKTVKIKEKFDDNKIKAEYKNEFANEKLNGKEASIKIENIFSSIDLKKQSNQSLINYLLNEIKIPEIYEKIKVEIQFQDGTKIKFSNR